MPRPNSLNIIIATPPYSPTHTYTHKQDRNRVEKAFGNGVTFFMRKEVMVAQLSDFDEMLYKVCVFYTYLLTCVCVYVRTGTE